jgi:hypothetical protein
MPDFDPSLTTYIRDGMALVQCMDAKKHRTFGDLATDYCRQLTSCFAKNTYSSRCTGNVIQIHRGHQWVTLIEFDNEVTKKVYECLLVFFDR